MNQFIHEALFIGAKEGLKLVLCAVLVLSFFKSIGREELRKPLIAGILTVFLASFAALSAPVNIEIRETLSKMIGYVFGLFYIFSLGALFHTAGTDILGPLKSVVDKRFFLIPAVFILTVAYFIPDMAGSSLYIADMFAMSGGRFSVFLSAGAGFALVLAASYFLPGKIRFNIIRLFGLPQVLLSLALIKLIAGGVHGFAELSLIPTVQAGLMKLTHDIVHQTLVLILIPDHPVLTMTAWKFIGILFGNTLALWFSLVIIVLPLVFFLRKHFSETVRVPQELPTGALRRKFIKSIKDERVLKSIPVFLFMLFIASTWFAEKGESAARLYNPEPTPLTIVDGGKVVIPIHGTAEDLLDGTLHKFSITLNGDVIRLLIMRRSDRTLAVCLDACEICPPDGYALAKEHVLCLYCNTPIPIDTLGKPGGCNPIPVTALVTDKDVQIRVTDITDRWSTVNRGKAKGGTEK